MGGFTGSIVAAFGLTLLPELLRGFDQYRMLVYSVNSDPHDDVPSLRPHGGLPVLSDPADLQAEAQAEGGHKMSKS